MRQIVIVDEEFLVCGEYSRNMLGLRAIQSGSACHADSMRDRTSEHQWIHLVAPEDILNYFKPGFDKLGNKSRMNIDVMYAK